MKEIDWSLYLVTDKVIIGGGSLIDMVRRAVAGGVSIVQYREKKSPMRLMVEEATQLRDICNKSLIPFIVNDRIDLALAVDADGVHLGQDDMPPKLARRILGKGKIIGITVHNESELEKAHEEPVDYVSFAPVFATSTKPDHQNPLGLEKLALLSQKSRLPSVAIGGIGENHVETLAQTNIKGICVVSAILGANDPEKAARRLKELWLQKKS